MIPAIAQTLAELLAEGTSLISIEQIDFSHPGAWQDIKPALNLYCYSIRATNSVPHAVRVKGQEIGDREPLAVSASCPPTWFDVSFLVSARDYTVLGEQHLLSEALVLLLHHGALSETLLVPTLRGNGDLPMTVIAVQPADAATLWNALGVPLRPALYVTVTIPVHARARPPDREVLLTPSSRGG